MKARPVEGLDPHGALAENLERIVRVRREELESFLPRALDPGEAEAAHDMRIAAKRLRYILELGAGVLGPGAAEEAKQAKRLQSVLGDVHDCDEMLPRVRALLDEARGTEAETGLEALAADLAERRTLAFERFRKHVLHLALTPPG